MNPEQGLHFAAVFLNFFLQITAAYCVCWMLNRLLVRPRQRFFVWAAFLLVSAGYWLAIIARGANALSSRGTAAGNVGVGAAPVTYSFQVPAGWSHMLLLAIQWLGLAYGVVLLALIIQACGRYLRLKLLLRRALEPSDELNELFHEICGSMGISRARLMILPGLKSPATAGWWKAHVLLPEACEELGATPQVDDVLCHELIHVQRRDCFWASLGNLVSCLLFFHPAMWMARSRMVLQGELACDEGVLNTRHGDRADYAESLTYFVRLRMLQEGFSVGVDFAASTALALRIRTILTAPMPLPWWKRTSRAATAMVLMTMLAAFAPALTVFLRFSQTGEFQTFVPLPAQTAASPARSPHRMHRREIAQQQSQDTLTTLRVKKYVPETPVYTMTSSDRPSAGGEVDRDAPAWKESSQPVRLPSVSSVVLSTMGQIPIANRRGGHGRDSDDH